MRNSIEVDEGWGEIFHISEDNLLNGYSFNVSKDICFANGIRPEDRLMVPVRSHSAWEGEASIIWRIQSTTRTTDVGRLRLLLARDFKIGDQIVVAPTPNGVGVYDAKKLGIDSELEAMKLEDGWELEEI